MSYILATNGYVECGQFVEIPIPTVKQTNLFKKSELFVNERRSKYGVVDITYVRDVVEIPLCATPAKTIFVYVDRNMISQRKESRDYLVNVSDLVISNIAVKPVQGDLIFEDVDGVRFTYEVGAFNGEPDWRYSGTYRTAFRIHSKLIDEETI